MEPVDQSDGKFRLLADMLPLAVVILDPNGGLVYSNRHRREYTGLPDSDPRVALDRMAFHPDDIGPVWECWKEALRTGIPPEPKEIRYRGRDGAYRWYRFSGAPLYDASGRIECWVSTGIDIQFQKEAEATKAQLEEVNHLQRGILDGSTGAIMATTAKDGVIQVFNTAAEAMFGYRREEVIGRRAIELLADEDDLAREAAKLSAELGRKVEPGRESMVARARIAGTHRREWVYRHKNGDRLPGEITVSPLHEADGTVTGYLSFMQNLSERKAVESALQESEERFRHAFEFSSVGMSFSGIDGRWLRVNRAVCEMLGYTEEELRQTTFQALTHPEDLTSNLELAGRLLAGEIPFMQIEKRYRHRDGHYLWGRLTASVIYSAKGEPSHYISQIENIDNWKQAEAALRKSEEQLRQAQKMEAVGQLAGGVAHDFNNILAAMMLNLGLMESDPGLDESVRMGLKEVEGHAQRATNLTRQLLMFGRRSVMNVRTISLNEVIENLLNMLRRLLAEQVRISFGGGVNLPLIKADSGMIEQVVMNLAVNARDAMPKGGHLTIRTEAVEIGLEQVPLHPGGRAGCFVKLSVGDTGCGMDAATVRHIFDPFFTTKEVGKGTGLGLSTVDGIVNQHRGWIEVASEIGQGSVFKIFLPIDDGMGLGSVLRAEPLPSKPVERVELALPKGSETILVVEDEALVRQGVVRILRMSGYRVLEAANGNEALLLWPKNCGAISLLFTDMIMPESLTGLELAERLRQEKPELKVIISSGYSMEMVSRGVPTDAGIVYLPKPYDMRALGTTVRDCLDR